VRTERLFAFGTKRGSFFGLDVFDVLAKVMELELFFELCAIVTTEFLDVAVYLVDLVRFCILVLFLCLLSLDMEIVYVLGN
jgi:hypothetical protein